MSQCTGVKLCKQTRTSKTEKLTHRCKIQHQQPSNIKPTEQLTLGSCKVASYGVIQTVLAGFSKFASGIVPGEDFDALSVNLSSKAVESLCWSCCLQGRRVPTNKC